MGDLTEVMRRHHRATWLWRDRRGLIKVEYVVAIAIIAGALYAWPQLRHQVSMRLGFISSATGATLSN